MSDTKPPAPATTAISVPVPAPAPTEPAPATLPPPVPASPTEPHLPVAPETEPEVHAAPVTPAHPPTPRDLRTSLTTTASRTSQGTGPQQTPVHGPRAGIGFVDPSHKTAKGPMQTPPLPGASTRSRMDGGTPPPIVQGPVVTGNVSTQAKAPPKMHPAPAAKKATVSKINPHYDVLAAPPPCIDGNDPHAVRPARKTKSGLKRPAPHAAGAPTATAAVRRPLTADGGLGATAPAAAPAVTVGSGVAVAPVAPVSAQGAAKA